jgi:alkyl hydroperoxide reductase subunit AhpC
MSIWRTKGKVEVESVAPDFTLPSQAGELVSLKDFIGTKPVVLFFYPKDDTPAAPNRLAPSGTNTRNSGSSMPRS